MTATVSALSPAGAADAAGAAAAGAGVGAAGAAAGGSAFYVGSSLWVSSMSPQIAVRTAKTITMLMNMMTKGLSVTG